jgi:hypothetical protein
MQLFEAARRGGNGDDDATTVSSCYYKTRCPFAWVPGFPVEFFKLPTTSVEDCFQPVTKEMTH